MNMLKFVFLNLRPLYIIDVIYTIASCLHDFYLKTNWLSLIILFDGMCLVNCEFTTFSNIFPTFDNVIFN